MGQKNQAKMGRGCCLCKDWDGRGISGLWRATLLLLLSVAGVLVHEGSLRHTARRTTRRRRVAVVCHLVVHLDGAHLPAHADNVEVHRALLVVRLDAVLQLHDGGAAEHLVLACLGRVAEDERDVVALEVLCHLHHNLDRLEQVLPRELRQHRLRLERLAAVCVLRERRVRPDLRLPEQHVVLLRERHGADVQLRPRLLVAVEARGVRAQRADCVRRVHRLVLRRHHRLHRPVPRHLQVRVLRALHQDTVRVRRRTSAVHHVVRRAHLVAVRRRERDRCLHETVQEAVLAHRRQQLVVAQQLLVVLRRDQLLRLRALHLDAVVHVAHEEDVVELRRQVRVLVRKLDLVHDLLHVDAAHLRPLDARGQLHGDERKRRVVELHADARRTLHSALLLVQRGLRRSLHVRDLQQALLLAQHDDRDVPHLHAGKDKVVLAHVLLHVLEPLSLLRLVRHVLRSQRVHVVLALRHEGLQRRRVTRRLRAAHVERAAPQRERLVLHLRRVDLAAPAQLAVYHLARLLERVRHVLRHGVLLHTVDRRRRRAAVVRRVRLRQRRRVHADGRADRRTGLVETLTLLRAREDHLVRLRRVEEHQTRPARVHDVPLQLQQLVRVVLLLQLAVRVQAVERLGEVVHHPHPAVHGRRLLARVELQHGEVRLEVDVVRHLRQREHPRLRRLLRIVILLLLAAVLVVLVGLVFVFVVIVLLVFLPLLLLLLQRSLELVLQVRVFLVLVVAALLALLLLDLLVDLVVPRVVLFLLLCLLCLRLLLRLHELGLRLRVREAAVGVVVVLHGLLLVLDGEVVVAQLLAEELSHLLVHLVHEVLLAKLLAEELGHLLVVLLSVEVLLADLLAEELRNLLVVLLNEVLLADL
eukprot:Rhum_TRINITY_DN15277_c1_g1::Rhum_TRINITY_DN15277_c1_g1_i5::g.149598::m.149598